MSRVTMAVLIALTISACGAIPDVGGLADIDEEAFEPGAGVSDAAVATLIVGDTTYAWEKNDWTTCDIGGSFPVWVGFQTNESTASGDWVQFIDRGDGGINFSAYLNGEEYHGTGSGEADEIHSDGFSYTGEMTSSGEPIDVRLDVTC